MTVDFLIHLDSDDMKAYHEGKEEGSLALLLSPFLLKTIVMMTVFTMNHGDNVALQMLNPLIRVKRDMNAKFKDDPGSSAYEVYAE